MSDEKIALIALNAVPYLGPTPYHQLLKRFGSAVNALKAGADELSSVHGISPSLAKKIAALDPEKTAKKELEYAKKVDASIVTFRESAYPSQLSAIVCPPPVISIQGEIAEEDYYSVAVVGARRPTAYGRAMTEKITKELAATGATIVSGLARGVDGLAHRAALAASGKTIAVLGNGLNIYYPGEHRELQKKIIQNGAVVSQFSFTQGPDKTTFPIRNRLISGLSLGVVVIEAGEKSGAKITAYAALDDNREVFALPGQINSPASVGTNTMIKKGHAKLVQTVDDILEELPEALWKKGSQQALKMTEKKLESLSDEESKVLEHVDGQAVHIDIITTASGLPPNIVSAILLALELKEIVKQTPGKLFSRI